MKILTNEQIIWLIEHCEIGNPTPSFCINCPLDNECTHYYTGENCGSALEEDE